MVEEFARFVLDSSFLTKQCKEFRHRLATLASMLPSESRMAARETRADVGTTISVATEQSRNSLQAVCSASMKRLQQALRTLEEYGKMLPPAVAGEFAQEIEALRYTSYTLERCIGVQQTSIERLQDVTLYILLDGCSNENKFQTLVETLVEANVGVLQLRDKNLTDRMLLRRARILVAATRGTRTLVIINDRADIALAAHADGVHVGQEELPIKDARTILGTEALIGVSTHTPEQAQTAVLDGANYLGVGPVFTSATKNFSELAGLEFVQKVADTIQLPWFAIGGIDEANIEQVLAAGAKRIAVSAAVTSAKNSANAARLLANVISPLQKNT